MWKKFKTWFPFKYYPERKYEYVYRDGKRIGPFIWSTAWTDVTDFEEKMLGKHREYWTKRMKAKAYNKRFEPRENPVHFIDDIIRSLKGEIQNMDDQLKFKNDKLKELGKELSTYKRGNEEISKLRSQVEKLEASHNQILDESVSMEHELKRLEFENEELQFQLRQKAG